jgi:tetratricopeptide (TPR) repeat protein
VLRAQGDLPREREVYHELPAELKESAFHYTGLGQLEARLSLYDAARAHLEKAVEIAPNDGRSLAALADFFLARGRYRQALPFAERGHQQRLKITEPDDQFAVGEVLVRAQLALGRLDDAQATVSSLNAQNGDLETLESLRGAVAYARGEYDRAAESFRRAAGDGTSFEPVLGLGLCQLVAKQWDEARTNLSRVAERDPLLRHRAHAALALLYDLTGHPEDAEKELQQALLIDPNDAYSIYLLGRQQRLKGSYEGAVLTQRRALGVRDDLVESLAENATSLLELSRRPEADDPGEILSRAVRYAERLVKHDATGNVAFVELLGTIKFELGDLAGARQAFGQALEKGSDLAQVGLALLDYRQKRTTEAREQLQSLNNDPSRAAPFRQFAAALIERIDEHASKEQVRDDFERQELGGLWETHMAGTVRPRIERGALVLKGEPKGAAWARRAVPAAGNILGAEVTMRLDPGTSPTFAGLTLSVGDARGAQGQQFELRVGLVKDSQGQLAPLLTLRDGQKAGDEVEPVLLKVDGFDARREHRLTVEAIPDPQRAGQIGLRALWDGDEVWSIPALKTLRATVKGRPLDIDLRVEAPRGEVGLTFDDFRIVRRKEG